MKLEEVIKYLIDGDFDALEQRSFYGGNYSDWCPLDRHILSWNLSSLLHSEFRLKKKKVKRYQVIYSPIGCLSECYITPPKNQKYKDKKDFDSWIYNGDKVFRIIVLESEEEFEE